MLGRAHVKAENASEDVLAVECGKHGDVATDTNTHDEQLIGSATHGLDLALDNLLHVVVALRLKQVLALSVPGTSLALVALLEDDWPLD